MVEDGSMCGTEDTNLQLGLRFVFIFLVGETAVTSISCALLVEYFLALYVLFYIYSTLAQHFFLFIQNVSIWAVSSVGSKRVLYSVTGCTVLIMVLWKESCWSVIFCAIWMLITKRPHKYLK